MSDNETSTNAMTLHYAKKYGKPKNDNEALNTMWSVYNSLVCPLDDITKEAIAEQYRTLNANEFPAYEWILESFHLISKKDQSKKNLKYAIGMHRQWMRSGFGVTPRKEEEEVMEYFEEMINNAPLVLGFESKKIVRKLMATHGTVKVVRSIAELKEHLQRKVKLDPTLFWVEMLSDLMDEQFGEGKSCSDDGESTPNTKTNLVLLPSDKSSDK